MKILRLFKDELVKDIRSWVSSGIITQSQAEKICSQYGISYDTRIRKNTGYIVLLYLGYLFIGLAIITILSANWDEIPRGLRMGGLIALTLAVNILGVVKFEKSRESSIALFFLGSLCYGASIMLIAQIYHIEEHYPDGIYWWAIPVAGLAFLLNRNSLTFLATGLGLAWFFSEASLGYYPVSFPVFILLLYYSLYKNRLNPFIFIAAVFSTGVWFEFTLAWQIGGFTRFEFGVEHFLFTAGLFLTFYGASRFLAACENQRLQDYGVLLNLWVVRFFIFSTFVLSFSEPWTELIRAKWSAPYEILVMCIFFSGLSGFLVFKGRDNLAPVAFLSSILLLTWLFLFNVEETDKAVQFQLVANLVLFVFSIWLIRTGIKESLSHYFFTGVVSMLALAFFRYVDLIGDYVGGAIVFLFFAVILLGSARYWKQSHGQKTTGAL